MFVLLALVVITSCKKDKDDDDDSPKLNPQEQALKDYTDNYLGSSVVDPAWTGSIAGCVSGDVSNDSHNKVVQRVNYFRKICGLPSNVTHNASQNKKCQDAALIMAANHTLTHTPSASMTCYTADGYDAASHGNLGISSGYSPEESSHSATGVTNYIEDSGSNNLPVGHRAWILFPTLSAIGHGSVFVPSQNNLSTNCLMWGDNLNGSTSGLPEFIAYPPANYVPAPLVFPRWSFYVDGGDFGGATVTMTDENGGNISTSIIHRASPNVIPGSRIVWEPSGINTTSSSDVKYTVTIDNISGAPKTSYTYEVIVLPVTQTSKRIKASDNYFREVK